MDEIKIQCEPTSLHSEVKEKSDLDKLISKSLFTAYMYCSIPPFIAQMTAALLILLDGIVIARVLGTDGLAAITYSTVTQNFIQGVSQIISTGSISILSTLTGNEQDIRYRDLVPSIIFWLNFIASIFVYIVLIPSIKYIYMLTNATGITLQYAVDYSNILIYFCPITIFSFTYTNALLAEGLSKWSMISNIIATLFNALISYLLLTYTSMGMKGAAVGSIISSGCSGILSIALFISSKTVTKIRPFLVFKEWRNTEKLIKKILSIGLGDGFPFFAFSIIMSISNYYFSSVFIEEERVDGFAAVGGIIKLYTILNAIFISFGSLGYLPLAGYFVGAQDEEKLKGITNLVLKFLSFILVTITIIAMPLNQYIGLIFSSNKVFLKYFKLGLFISLPTLFLAGIQFTCISTGQALGLGSRIIISSILCLVVYQPLLIIILYYITHSFYGVMMSFPLNDIFSFITCMILFRNSIVRPGEFMRRHVDSIAENDDLPVVMGSQENLE